MAPVSLAEQWEGGHAWHVRDADRRLEVARRCLKLVRDVTEFDSVVDFGTGIGAWPVAARNLGASKVLGIEGDWITNSETILERENYHIMDLSQQGVDLKKAYDLAMTIEVIEHLPPEAADMFLDSLVNASNYVLFSAARKGQGGRGHINERYLSYWIKKFWARGYVPLELIRPYIAGDKTIYWWIRQNIVMFVSYSEFLRNEKLHRFARPLPDFSLHYVSKAKAKAPAALNAESAAADEDH